MFGIKFFDEFLLTSAARVLAALLLLLGVCSPVLADDLMNQIRQRIVVGWPGAAVAKYSGLGSQVKYGGYVVFGSQAKLGKDLCREKPKGGFFLMDHEGGVVNRIASALPSAKMASRDFVGFSRQWGLDMERMNAMCVDVVLGPMVDTAMDGGGRSFSSDFSKNAAFSQALMRESRRAGIVSAIKHYPGSIGSCSRVGRSKEVFSCDPTVEAIASQWSSLDLFGIPIVMTSFNRFPRISQKYAFADSSVMGLLRGQMRFDGVTLTDSITELPDIDMDESLIHDIFLNNDMVMILDDGLADQVAESVAQMMGSDASLRESHRLSLGRIEALKSSR